MTGDRGTLDTDRMRRALDLFDSVVDLPPEEREAALRELAGGDEQLVAAALELLSADGDTSTFELLHGGGIGAAPTRAPELDQTWDPTPKPAQRAATATPNIGNFQILGVLGEGGMGTVYLAEQTEPVHRRVALKLIRSNFAHPSAVARFQIEQQAMARLSHANVARIHEAGTTDEGWPWFAMEHVDGTSLTDYCDSKRLPVVERLAVFVAVCRGVEHAHQRGIMHRDLKPTNVLVTEEDGRPVPKVIDFGIAKAPSSARAQLTGAGMIGTPAYMSPESMMAKGDGLDLDTRHDVYALGVLLFELLTGTRPFETVESNVPKLIMTVVNSEPRKASTLLPGDATPAGARVAELRGTRLPELRRRLSGDLDSIVSKAVAREREERYGSAAELAADVVRYLNDEPVLAMPPALAYRARKFVRRNQLLVAATGAVFVALVLGIVGTSMGMVRANREAERANQEAERANREAAAATEISEFLTGLFEVSDPSEARGATITARELLERGVEQIDRELGNQPLVQARLLDTMGRVQGELGLLDDSEVLLERALAQRRELLGDEHLDVATSAYNLGGVRHWNGNIDEGAALLEEALSIRRAALGDDHIDVAECLNDLGLVAMTRGEYRRAEELLQETLRILSLHLPGTHTRVLTSRSNLAMAYDRSGKGAEAEPIHRDVLRIRREVLGGDHHHVGVSLTNLSLSLRVRGELEEAEGFAREAVDLYVRILGEGHPRALDAKGSLSLVLEQLGELDEAEQLVRETVAGWEALHGSEHNNVARAKSNLGSLLTKTGRYDEAEPYFREALETRRALLGDDHPDTAASVNGLARMLKRSGRLDEAVPLYREALAVRRRKLGNRHISTAVSLNNLASALSALGEREEAITLSREAVQIAESIDGASPKLVEALKQTLANITGEEGAAD